MYELYLTLHVLSVVVWVGGAVLMQILASRARGAGDPARMAAYGQDAEFVGTKVFMPASIVALLTGIGLVVEGPWTFEDAWVAIGLAALVATVLAGMLYLGPESRRVKGLVQERGPGDPEVRRRVERLSLVSLAQTLVLVLVVVDMVVKPGA